MTNTQPMPADGRRRLTQAEAMRRSQAMACLRQQHTQCQGQVYVNLFFDGTGNNRNWAGTYVHGKTRSQQTQLNRNGHSNVARLFDASYEDDPSGLFRYYIPGVGTPFPEVGDTDPDGNMFGGGAALYGADRIHWGVLQVLNSIHRYLMGAPLWDREMTGKMAREMSYIISPALRQGGLSGIAIGRLAIETMRGGRLNRLLNPVAALT